MKPDTLPSERNSRNFLKKKIEDLFSYCKQNLPEGELNNLLEELELYHQKMEQKTHQLETRIKELAYNEELLREMGSVAQIGGWEFDPETGKGTWTEETARIHDMDPKKETNVELGMSFYTADSKIKIEEAVKMAIEKQTPYDLELKLVTAKGKYKWVRTIGKPTVKNGKVVKMRGSFQDITHRKMAELELQKLKNNLEKQVQEKTKELQEYIADLERFHEATIEREFRIKELKKEIKALKKENSKPEP